jgi:transposase
VELTSDERAELRALVNSGEVLAAVGTRARIVLWHAEGRRKKDIAALAGVSRPTVDLWLGRYAVAGRWAARSAARHGGGEADHPATTPPASPHDPAWTMPRERNG